MMSSWSQLMVIRVTLHREGGDTRHHHLGGADQGFRIIILSHSAGWNGPVKEPKCLRGLRRDMRADWVYGWSCREMWEWDCLMSGLSADIYTCNLLLFAPGEETQSKKVVPVTWWPRGSSVLIRRIPVNEVYGVPARWFTIVLGELIKKYIIM